MRFRVHRSGRADGRVLLLGDELQHQPGELVRQLGRDGSLDATIVRGDWPGSGLRFTPLWTDEILVALPAAHPLAANEIVDFPDLAALPVRLSSPERNRPLHDLVLASCREAGFEPALGKEFTTAQDTLGFSRPHWTVFRPLHNPAPRMPTYLATSADRRLTPQLVSLIEAAHAIETG